MNAGPSSSTKASQREATGRTGNAASQERAAGSGSASDYSIPASRREAAAFG
jgi:hypothetical protein